MTRLFVDASALVAIITREPDDETLGRTMSGFPVRLCSPLAIWEATVAVARKRNVSIDQARTSVAEFLAQFDIMMVPVGAVEAEAALAAWARYGRTSGERARLNMGDCFAYACARTNRARLLYKGDDFVHTDLG